VARGDKVVSLAEPETRAYTLDLIETIEDFDLPIVAGPKMGSDPGRTLH
jgi:hypothetical protein